MHITRLTVENVKRLKVARVEPDGRIVRITGKNGQGKSSVLDSIAYAIGGAALLPEKPLRKGEKKGFVEVQFDDLGVIVTRTFTEKGTDLTIQSKDGAVYPSPQRMLDTLFGKLSFDPLAFLRKKPAEQVETLLSVIDLKADPKRLEELAPGSTIEDPIKRLGVRYKIVYEERTDKNKEVKLIEGELAALPAETPDDPKDSVNVSGLVKKRDELVKERDRQANTRTTIGQMRVREGDLRAEIAKLQATLKGVEEARAGLEAQVATFEDVEPAIAAHDDMIEEAQGVNERYGQVVRRREVRNRLDLAVAASKAMTEKLEKIRGYKEELVANANMPVPGLGFTEGAVTFNGIELAEASQAEQIRVSVAIAAALNPKLKVMLVREASLLDQASLALLAKLAEEKDLQIWMESVDDTRRVGVVIEDGTVAVVNPGKGGSEGSDDVDEVEAHGGGANLDG